MHTVQEGTIQEKVLALLQRGPTHLDTFCRQLAKTERQIRSAIDHLRARGLNIKRDGPKVWSLR